ncbi:delta-60 repeat domain-containing protein [Dokdonella sp.]|uniref:delta-60 repeat domain-containing protein n=1 Tax=Dokdonella sp. TaxID=2291710 RepID=UPI0027B8AC7D|nr:delta-60 repeat domain-containing protein [Dokdonella sp.]
MNLRIRVFPAIVSVATLLAMLPALPAQAADVDPGFLNPDASGDIDALALQPDGKLLVGGGFDEIGGQIRNRAARLNANGSADTGFADPNATYWVTALAALPDGKVLVAGAFEDIGAGYTRKHVARLNANGSVDTSFGDPDASTVVEALAVQPDGKVFVGGSFITIGGQDRNYVARLNLNGSLDTAFAEAGVDYDVHALALQPDGKLFVGGEFSHVAGQPRSGVARLGANGGLDTSFANPALSDIDGWDAVVHALALQPDGKLLVAGQFVKVGTQQRTSIARLNANGSLDASFLDSAADGFIDSIALQADGKMFVTGNFSMIGGQARASLARLNANGSLDTSFPSVDTDGDVDAMAVQPDGKLLIGGSFESVDGHAFVGLARLVLSDPAQQSLDAQGSTFTWHRSGAVPELIAPPILYASPNGTSYTAIGPMTRVSGGWQRTSVSLPAGTVWVRAQGRVGSGANSASSGLIASRMPAPGGDVIFIDGFE